jgi:pimeloyl-ACP methyl ester carboxylesterase
MTRRRLVAAAATTSLLLGGLAAAVPSSASAEPTITHDCLLSVGEPRSEAPVKICYTLFQPAGATAESPVPMVLHGHGWGGSRTRTPGAFAEFLDNGYGVLSIDQRGFGESGGRAHTFQADIEGHDIRRIVDVVAALPWVAKDPGTTDDPVLGAIGGSYGGGYQYLGAFSDMLYGGHNRFDALAPEITWHDLKEALAPQEVARSTWLSLLTATSVADNDERAQRAFAYGAATGLWPKGPAARPSTPTWDAYFEKAGPGGTSRRAVASTSPCSRGRDCRTPCSTSTRRSRTSTPHSPPRPGRRACSSATTAATCCRPRSRAATRPGATPARASWGRRASPG